MSIGWWAEWMLSWLDELRTASRFCATSPLYYIILWNTILSNEGKMKLRGAFSMPEPFGHLSLFCGEQYRLPRLHLPSVPHVHSDSRAFVSTSCCCCPADEMNVFTETDAWQTFTPNCIGWAFVFFFWKVLLLNPSSSPLFFLLMLSF